MKKLIITIFIFIMLSVPFSTHAATELELRNQLIILLQQMIQILTIRLNELRNELAAKNITVEAVVPPPAGAIVPPSTIVITVKATTTPQNIVRYGEHKILLEGGCGVVDENKNILFKSSSCEESLQWYKKENIQPIPQKSPKQCRYQGKNLVCN